MHKLRNSLFTVLTVFLVVGVISIISEICFRIFREHVPLEVTTQKHHTYLFEPNSSETNFSSIDGEFEYTHHINNSGYRGKDFTSPKSEDVSRIFFVGDSFTFGVGAEDGETIPAQVEKLLRSNGQNVEVVNAGVGHTSPISHYVNLRDIHLNHHPDMVVLLFDLTDMWDDWYYENMAITDRKTGEIKGFNPMYRKGRRSWWLTLKNHSAFANYVDRKIVRAIRYMGEVGFLNYIKLQMQGKKMRTEVIGHLQRTQHPNIIKYDGLIMLRGDEMRPIIEHHFKRCEKYLKQIDQLLSQHDIPWMLVSYPHGIYVGPDQWEEGRLAWGFEADKQYTDQLPFELLTAFSYQNNIPVISMLDDLIKNNDKKLFFEHDGHMTPIGNEIVAKRIVNSPVFNQIFQKSLNRE